MVMTVKTKPWHKHYPAGVPKSISYPLIPLHMLLEETAEKYSQKVALSYCEKEITYSLLDSLSNQFANVLLKLGVEKGDRVAVFLPNIPQFIITYFGALKAGAVVTAISPLHREREVEHQLSDSGAKTIITLDSLHHVLEKARIRIRLNSVIITGLDEFDSKITLNTEIPNTLSFGKLINEAPKQPPSLQFDSRRDLAALQYTGGTTGIARGAMLTHKNLVSNALAFAAWIKGTNVNEIFLTVLPLSHIYGMTTSMNAPISIGAKIVLMPKFEPAKALETIQKEKVTVFCGVPTMYSALLLRPEISKYDLTSIRTCISGASPLPPHVQKEFMELTGGFLAEGYGLTEASPVTHCTPVDRSMQTVRVGSIGLPLPSTDARIVDLETGDKVLTLGEIGELAVEGPQVMKGYWCRPEETATVLRGDWLLTGDIARMDEDGYFYVIDRKKDLIKYKGYSIYPREIEDIIYEHPSVKLCAVVGKPDTLAGEVPKAFIVPKDGVQLSAKEIMAFVNDIVAPYKALREVEFMEKLPISPTGKVLKLELRQEEKQKAGSGNIEAKGT
jgi:long-chain acyl-CoA synthetase